MLSGGSWVQIPAGSTTRVFKQTGETDDRVIGGVGGGGTLASVGLVFFILLSLGKSKGEGGGGGKRTHTSVGNEYRKFSRWCCLPFTHHLCHGLWVGYSELINGLITAASGALAC